MSLHISAQYLSDAWMEVLAAVNAEDGGTATHVLVSVGEPQAGAHDEVSEVVDGVLSSRHKHAVTTVANTIFPAAVYNDPGFAWSADLPEDGVLQLDTAANELYETYLELLPTLQRVYANQSGTYFSRMISWPGKTSAGVNQLATRIEALRNEHRQRRKASNFSDIAIAGEADGTGGGLEEFAVSDNRTRGFPCLVHIDISVRDGALSILGVYRHWHLITRGYGNLVGLARLQEFMCQQTGYRAGELAVVAGHANAERSDYSGKAGVHGILADAVAARQTVQAVSA